MAPTTLRRHPDVPQAPAKPVKGMVPHGTDTVPAMLTPDEAVLNKHGADIIGRDKIAAANAIGNHIAKQHEQAQPPAGKSGPAKGMIQAKGKAGPGAPQRHAEGCSSIHHYAEGTSTVQSPPGPGQTITNGSWEGPTNTPAPPAPVAFPVPGAATGTFGKRTPQTLAGGTHQVRHGKSAKTPTKIDPAAVLSLLGSMQGGAPGAGGAPMAPPPARGMV